MAVTRIRLRRGTAAAWAAADPVMAAGEVGVDLDTGELRIGDGTKAWSALTPIGVVSESEIVSAVQAYLLANPVMGALDDLTDVEIGDSTPGDVLMVDEAGVWGPAAIPAPDLSGYVQTTDPRLGDARTPTAHKASHATGGADALTPADIGAQPAGSYAAASHTQAALTISDSTAVGRSVLTAADAAAARAAIGAGTAGATETLAYTYTASATAYDGSAISIDLATNVWTIVGHTFVNGDEVAIHSKRSGGNPAGTTLGRRYLIANVSGNAFTIQTSGANVDVTAAGSTAPDSWFISKTVSALGAEGLALPKGHIRVKVSGNFNTGTGTDIHGGVKINNSTQVADISYERCYVDLVIRIDPFDTGEYSLAKAEGMALGVARSALPATNYVTPVGMFAQGGNVGLYNDKRIYSVALTSAGNATKLANGTRMEVYTIG